MGAVELITEMIMPLISTAFLSNEFVHTPILLGFVSEGLALLVIYHVPVDTCTVPLEASLPTNTQQDDSQNALQASSEAAKSDMLKNLAGAWREGGIMTDAKVVTLLGCFALVKKGRQMLEMLVQYISRRYGWTFAQVSSFQHIDWTKLTSLGQHCIFRQRNWKLAPVFVHPPTLEADPSGRLAISYRPR
jgi:hypothetical protein